MTYSFVALLNQVGTNGVPSQGSTPGNEERLPVGRVKDLSEETDAVAEYWSEGRGDVGHGC